MGPIFLFVFFCVCVLILYVRQLHEIDVCFYVNSSRSVQFDFVLLVILLAKKGDGERERVEEKISAKSNINTSHNMYCDVRIIWWQKQAIRCTAFVNNVACLGKVIVYIMILF